MKTPYFVFFSMSILTILEVINGTSLPHERGSSSELQDCKVHRSYTKENLQGETLSFLTFVEYGEVLSTKISFQDQHEDLVYDKLVLSHEEITLYHARHGIVNETTLDQFLITPGWTLVEISITNLFTFKYWNTTVVSYTLDLPVDRLLVHGSNITVCKERFPTWRVEQGVSTKIPLEPTRQVVNPYIQRTHTLILQSDEYFPPCIGIDGNKTCLEVENNKKSLGRTLKASLLWTGKWDLYLEVVPGHINVYKKIYGKQTIVASLPKQGMKFIEFTSYDSKFSVSLNVLGLPKSSSLTSTDYHPVSTTPHYKTSSNIGMNICIGIVIGMMVLCGSVIIFIVIRRRRQSSSSDYVNKASIGYMGIKIF